MAKDSLVGDVGTLVSDCAILRRDRPLADGILDPLVHNAHRIEMRGDSMRKETQSPARRER